MSAAPHLNRRAFCAAAAALTLPYLAPSVARASPDQGAPPAEPGPIDLGATVKGYRVQSLRAHSINGYWITGRDRVFCVDAYWRIPEAREAMEAFESVTGHSTQAVHRIAITHPHSDHYGGLATLRAAANGAPAVTSDTVHRVIRNDEHGFYANRLEDFPEDIPADIPVPARGLQDGIAIEAADQFLDVALLRGNEAIETALLYVPEDRVLITGDLVNNKTTPVLYQGGLDAWIAQLSGLRRRFPEARTIAPGHGEAGDFDTLVAEEIAYLRAFSRFVEAELERSDGAVPPDGVTRITHAVRDSFPDWRTSAGIPDLNRLIALNIGWTLQGWRLQTAGTSTPRAFREDE